MPMQIDAVRDADSKPKDGTGKSGKPRKRWSRITWLEEGTVGLEVEPATMMIIEINLATRLLLLMVSADTARNGEPIVENAVRIRVESRAWLTHRANSTCVAQPDVGDLNRRL